MSPRKRIRQTSDYILLGLLSRQPMHGYELHKEIILLEGIGMVWRIKQSQLYALLEKLENESLLTAELVSGEMRPDRKEYHLTPLGEEVFQAWVNDRIQHAAARCARISWHACILPGPSISKMYSTCSINNKGLPVLAAVFSDAVQPSGGFSIL